MEKNIIPIKTDKINSVVTIVPIFDTHILNPTFDKEMYKKCINYIANKDATYWFGGGDYGEFIKIKDKRFNALSCYPDLKVKDLARIVDLEREIFEEETGPILNPEKCLGLGEGNHDIKISKEGDGEIVRDLCTAHNVRYLGYSGFIKLVFSRGASTTSRSFTIYYHHGWSAARMTGGKVNYIERMAKDNDCNIAVTGHCHTRVTTGPIDIPSMNSNKPLLKYGIICGSWKRGVGWGKMTWEETRGYGQDYHRMGTWAIQIIPFPSNNQTITFRVIPFDAEWVGIGL